MIRSLVWLALSILMCAGVRAEAQQDYSNETYPVDFLPWANRKIAIRDSEGNWIGYSKNQAPFRILVDGNSMRAARTSEGIDIGTLLRNMSPRRGTDGHLYLTMTLEKDVELDDDTTLPSQAVDADGNPKKKEILIDIDDFYISRSMQPARFSTSTEDAPAPEQTQAALSNDLLAREGVTDATEPDNTPEEATAVESVGGEEEEESDVTPQGITFALGEGDEYPTRFLSSPLCSKNGERHVTTSGLTPRGQHRGRLGRDGRCRASNGRIMSCHHQGLDIAARVGTPVLAAADGCFKVKKSEGRSTLPPAGTKISEADLCEGRYSTYRGKKRCTSGYGFTIRLTHGNRWETQYSHLSGLAPNVKWGRCVKRGEVIGYSGNSGQVTGQHFHFGVARGRKIMNPVSSLISTSGSFLSPSCSNIPKYTELDRTMRAALAAGRSTRTARMSSGSRSVR